MTRTRRCSFRDRITSWRVKGTRDPRHSSSFIVVECWCESLGEPITRVPRDWIAPCWIVHSWCAPRSDTCRLFSVGLLSWGSEIAKLRDRPVSPKSRILRAIIISRAIIGSRTWIFDLFLPMECRFHRQLNVRRDFARGKKRRKRARATLSGRQPEIGHVLLLDSRLATVRSTIASFAGQLSISWSRIKSRKGVSTERHASTRVSAWPGDLT